jgi:tetratricopeptide (TPR) repeat protein
MCTAQTFNKVDSLKRELLTVKSDTSKMQIMLELRTEYDLINVDSTLFYSQQALRLAQQIHSPKNEAGALYAIGSSYRRMGEIPKGLDFIYKGLQISTVNRDSKGLASGYTNMGLIHFDLDEYITAINNFHVALKVREQLHDSDQQVYLLMRIAYAYSKNKQSDSASAYMQKAIDEWNKLKLTDYFNGLYFELIGEIEFASNNRGLAFDYLNKSIQINQKNNFLLTGSIAHIVIAGFYKESGQIDSAIFHAKQGLVEAKIYGAKKRVLEASSMLANCTNKKTRGKHFTTAKCMILQTRNCTVEKR